MRCQQCFNSLQHKEPSQEICLHQINSRLWISRSGKHHHSYSDVQSKVTPEMIQENSPGCRSVFHHKDKTYSVNNSHKTLWGKVLTCTRRGLQMFTPFEPALAKCTILEAVAATPGYKWKVLWVFRERLLAQRPATESKSLHNSIICITKLS